MGTRGRFGIYWKRDRQDNPWGDFIGVFEWGWHFCFYFYLSCEIAGCEAVFVAQIIIRLPNWKGASFI